MDYAPIKKQIADDEGCRLYVYPDSMQKLTVGIGHLVRKEDGLAYGDSIPQVLCDQFFEQDFENAVDECERHLPKFKEYPEPIRGVLINMAFNLGIAGLLHFRKFIAALNRADYLEAANQMQLSDWYSQVGKRSRRLMDTVLNEVKEITIHQ